jgi:hypothetical protein
MKGLIIFAIAGFGLVWIAPGQTNQLGISDADGQEILALIHKYHLVQTSLAYQSAELPRMLAEANFFAERLKLPVPHPIQLSDVKDFHVTAPWYSGLERGLQNTNITSPIVRIRAATVTLDGAIEMTNFSFFFTKGKMWNAVRLHEPSMNPYQFHELATQPSLIDTAQAYQMATQWLRAIAVDVPALESRYKLTFYQWRVWSSSAQTNKLLLPIFDIKWGEGQMQFADETAAKITILGTTKELMELQLQDGEFSHRPQMIISNAFELCSIPDPPIKQLQSLSMSPTNSP